MADTKLHVHGANCQALRLSMEALPSCSSIEEKYIRSWKIKQVTVKYFWNSSLQVLKFHYSKKNKMFIFGCFQQKHLFSFWWQLQSVGFEPTSKKYGHYVVRLSDVAVQFINNLLECDTRQASVLIKRCINHLARDMFWS